MVLQMPDSAATVVIDDILTMIAQMLRAQTNGKVPKEVRVYAQCFAQCCHVNVGELVAAKLYVARLQKGHPSLHASFAVDSMIRIYITSIILAAKFLNDSVHPNSEWATASGRYTSADVNKMELEFLALVQYELFFSPAAHAAALAQYVDGDGLSTSSPVKRVSAVATPAKHAPTWCPEDMDVDVAVSTVVNGPRTTSPDVHRDIFV